MNNGDQSVFDCELADYEQNEHAVVKDDRPRLVPSGTLNPAEIFSNRVAVEQIVNGVGLKVENIIQDAGDLYTADDDKGRKALKSLSREIASSRIYLDNLGKEYGADLKEQFDKILSFRRFAKVELQSMQDGIVQPVKDWELEQERIQLEAATKAKRLAEHVEAIEMDADFDERREFARKQKILDAQIAENNRIAAELKAKQDIKEAAAEAVELERYLADMKAMAQQQDADRRVREAEQATIAANRRAQLADEHAKAEVARKEMIKLQEQEAAEAETKRLAEDQDNRLKVMARAASAICALGFSKEVGKTVVAAIAAGFIDGVSISFNEVKK